MLQLKSILVFERDPARALDLAVSIASVEATVIGPATNAHHARMLVDKTRLDGAVLDLHQDEPDALDVIHGLIEKGVPFVAYSEDAPPAGVRERYPNLGVFRKDIPDEMLIEALIQLIEGG